MVSRGAAEPVLNRGVLLGSSLGRPVRRVPLTRVEKEPSCSGTCCGAEETERTSCCRAVLHPCSTWSPYGEDFGLHHFQRVAIRMFFCVFSSLWLYVSWTTDKFCPGPSPIISVLHSLLKFLRWSCRTTFCA
uniref:Uncharacterized protein n=1 Tax=Denticeps clupeoides TaxID=299321 RepID=A0AAY4CM45_9TELE